MQVFQSHNGAIAAVVDLENEIVNPVSIPQWCDCCLKYEPDILVGALRFNPTMVRLLLDVTISAAGGGGGFQSHNGAIAAHKVCENRLPPSRVSIPQWCDCCQARKPLSRFGQQCFNPTMVRLLPTQQVLKPFGIMFQSHNGAIAASCHRKNLRHIKIVVSIPQWCDCCSQPVLPSKRRHEVSIPQWCDCCCVVMTWLGIVVFVSIPQWCDCCVNS